MKKYLAKLKNKKTQKKEETELPIITLKEACPICNSEIRGNKKILYYCKKCNMLFREKDLEK